MNDKHLMASKSTEEFLQTMQDVGGYSREELEEMSDQELAHAVTRVWIHYALDKRKAK